MGISKRKIKLLLTACALIAAACGLVLCPQEVADACRDGLSVCANVMVPSLFPFFVLSSLIVGLGLAEYPGRLLQRVMQPLFRVNGNGSAALVLGWIGGYPVGARTTVELYREGLVSRTEAQRLLAFCNNSGPAFLIGVVGSGVFGSGKVGILLCLIHILTSIFVGMLFRFYHWREPARPASHPRHTQSGRSFGAVFPRSVTDSVTVLLNVCGFVLLFSVLLRLLTLTGALDTAAGVCARFGLERRWSEPLLQGIVELSNGVTGLPGSDLSHSLPIAAFLLGWGGVSVHCQTLSLLQGTDLNMSTCLLGKLLHGLCSALLVRLVLSLWPRSVATDAELAFPLHTGQMLPPQHLFLLSLVGGGVLLLICLGIKNRGGN